MEGASAAAVNHRTGFIDHHYHVQDEAYELGYQWANIYESGSPSRKLIAGLINDALLVNIVHNDFHDQNKIFEPFFKLEEELGSKATAATSNGHAVVTNGHAN